MAYIVTIVSKKDTDFLNNSKIILESNQYKEIATNIYIGQKSSSIVVQNLKNNDIYKLDKIKCGIEIYHGNVTKI
jgi:hypothetical protein